MNQCLKWIVRIAAMGFAGLLSAAALAQGYPTKQVTLFLGLGPGSGLDIAARILADRLTQNFGRPFVVENKPGGAQIVTTNALIGAPADGHALMVVTSGPVAINPSMFKSLPYDAERDFIPIALYVKSPFVLIVDPALPIRSVPELVEYAKARQGKLSYSSPSVGGAPHLSMAMVNQRYGLDIAHIVYKSTSQGILDVASGTVQMAFAEAGASLSLIKAGKLRALAVSSTTRFATLPDIPTFAEAANAPEFEAVSWHVLMARSGTPREIVNRLHEEMKRIMAVPEVRERIANLGLIPIDTPSVEGIQEYIRSEEKKWGGLVRQLGLAGTQ